MWWLLCVLPFAGLTLAFRAIVSRWEYRRSTRRAGVTLILAFVAGHLLLCYHLLSLVAPSALDAHIRLVGILNIVIPALVWLDAWVRTPRVCSSRRTSF